MLNIVIQAAKLQKALTLVKDIVAKGPETQGSIAHHVLVEFKPESNTLEIVASDRDINHHTYLTLEPALGESATLSPKGDKPVMTIACHRLMDTITGLTKDKLITIDGSGLNPNLDRIQILNVKFDKTQVAIEATNGKAFGLHKDHIDPSFRLVNVNLPQRALLELFESTIFSISSKSTPQIKSVLTLNFYPDRLQFIAAQNTRLGLAEYAYKDPETAAQVADLIGEDNDCVTINLTRQSSLEVMRLLSRDEGNISLQIYLSRSNIARILKLEMYPSLLLFNLTGGKSPAVKNVLPKNEDAYSVEFSGEIVKEVITRATKFHEVVKLEAKEEGLRVTADIPTTNESFVSECNYLAFVEPFEFKLKGKLLIEIITPILDFARARAAEQDKDNKEPLAVDVPMRLYRYSFNPSIYVYIVREASTDSDIKRTYVLTPYSQVNNDSND